MVVTRINDLHSRNPRLSLVPPTFGTFAISEDSRWSTGQDAALSYGTDFLFRGQCESVFARVPPSLAERSCRWRSWRKVCILSSRPECYPSNQERSHFTLMMGTWALVCVDADTQAVLVQTEGSPKAEDSLKFVILLLRFPS